MPGRASQAPPGPTYLRSRRGFGLQPGGRADGLTLEGNQEEVGGKSGVRATDRREKMAWAPRGYFSPQPGAVAAVAAQETSSEKTAQKITERASALGIGGRAPSSRSRDVQPSAEPRRGSCCRSRSSSRHERTNPDRRLGLLSLCCSGHFLTVTRGLSCLEDWSWDQIIAQGHCRLIELSGCFLDTQQCSSQLSTFLRLYLFLVSSQNNEVNERWKTECKLRKDESSNLVLTSKAKRRQGNPGFYILTLRQGDCFSFLFSSKGLKRQVCFLCDNHKSQEPKCVDIFIIMTMASFGTLLVDKWICSAQIISTHILV
jgi:hypothetical protein